MKRCPIPAPITERQSGDFVTFRHDGTIAKHSIQLTSSKNSGFTGKSASSSSESQQESECQQETVRPGDTPPICTHPCETESLHDLFGELEQVNKSPEPIQAERLEHYQILRVLGKGGMGEVYEAWDTYLERPVAIKAQRRKEGRRASERFRRELIINGQLNHPNIVKTLGCLEHLGHFYLVQEYIDGNTLQDSIVRGVFDDIQSVIQCLVQICDGIGHLHGKGYVHGDLKPENIMIDLNGTVKLIDHGLSFRNHSKDPNANGRAGTIGFASPEQINGTHVVDHRSDIYSLGRVLEFIIRQLSKEIEVGGRRKRPRSCQKLSDLKVLSATLMQRDPEQRPSNVRSIRESLQEISLDRFRNEQTHTYGVHLFSSLFAKSFRFLNPPISKSTVQARCPD